MNVQFLSYRLLKTCVAIFALAMATCLFFCVSALAAPTINNASLRGLQIGGTTTIAFDGGDLLADPKILATFPIAKQAVVAGASASRVQIEITLDASVSPGVYQLRLASSKGISNAIAVGVDRLPQQPIAPQVAALPVALHGAVNGSEVQRVTFNGKKDERVVIDVESRRLGANLKPVLRMYDERGKQVAWSPQQSSIAGDARCNVTLPADGAYTVELNDLLYRAAAPSFFRLKIGALSYADLAFPVGVTQGTKTPLQFAGSNLPAEARAELDASAPTPLPLDRPAPVPAAANFTGPAPRVVVSAFPEVVEAAPPAGLQAIEQVPSAINGRLSAAGEEDNYLLTVAPGAKLRFDVLARRLGSPIDGVLTVRGEKGEQPVANDDRPGQADPGLDYTVPASVTKLIVSLRDLQRRGGPDSIYRIAITDLARPDFGLALDADRINIPAGGTQVVKVVVDRQGYDGPIKLDVSPMSVALAGQEIPAGATIGLLTVTAPAGAPQSMLATILGSGGEMPNTIVRTARIAESPVSQRQPWFRGEFGVAVSEPTPLAVAWVPGAPDEKLPKGGKLEAKLQFTRAPGVAGPIRVQLVTTQVAPKKKIKENNVEKEVVDIDRTLRLEGVPMFGAEINEGVVNLLVPADLPSNPWGLVLIAELLSADGKSVAASSATPARQLMPAEKTN